MSTSAAKYAGFCESAFGSKLMQSEALYLRQQLNGYQRVLDIGCGTGAIEKLLPELDLVGLDASGDMLCEAEKRCPNRFFLGQASHLDFENGSFDAVLFVTSLEFMPEYQLALNEAARVLRPGGKLIILMLNPESAYFTTHYQKPGSYFRQIEHTSPAQIESYFSNVLEFQTSGEYFLGIDGETLFETSDRKLASLYAIKALKPAVSDLRQPCAASGANDVR